MAARSWLPAPLLCRAAAGLAARVTASGAQGGRPALPGLRHPRPISQENEPFPAPRLRGGASVVGEWVPQEDEDQDDAGGGQGGAGDVEEPGGLGIFHGSVQVVEQLLVPDLQPQRRSERGADPARREGREQSRQLPIPAGQLGSRRTVSLLRATCWSVRGEGTAPRCTLRRSIK